MPSNDPKIEFETKQIGEKLAGATILGPIHSDDNSAFGFVCKLPNSPKRIRVWVDRDTSGERPGHLEIEEES